MKTAKQINNLHTGEIVPIVIETDGNAIKPMTKFHAMSCGVCGKPMTVIKCNDCQHKADLEEIPKAILSHIKEQSPDCGCEFCVWLRDHDESMWGSGYDNGEYDTKEEFQKQKQEMWKDFMGHISMKSPNMIEISIETGQLECLKHKWGIE